MIDPASDTARRQRETLDPMRRLRYFPHLGLSVLAQNSAGFDVRILDERLERCEPDRLRVDLVGITVRTALAPRAHALARRFHGLGVPVVFGGPYATLTPDLALADPAVSAIVSGVGEAIWPEVLTHFANGRLKQRYCGRLPSSESAPPVGQRSPAGYRPGIRLVQAIKGCNFNCSFCVVPRLYGASVSTPSMERLVESIAAIRDRNLVIVDDNFIADRAFARAFCHRMIGLGKRWTCQATLNLACDASMMALMAKAGCRLVNIGLETLNERTWTLQRKRQNFSCEFGSAIARFHQHGLMVSGGFVFGFDEDDSSVFDRTLEFTERSRLDFAACHVLTPYPGLHLHEELKRDGRIITDDLARYNTHEVVFRPMQMTAEQLQSGFDWVVKEFYSADRILSRLGDSLGTCGTFAAFTNALIGVVVHSNLNRGLPIHA